MSKPLLRILKLAYKLHKAGASETSTVWFISMARHVPTAVLPSASASVDVIVAEVYNNMIERVGTDEITVHLLASELGFDVEGSL